MVCSWGLPTDITGGTFFFAGNLPSTSGAKTGVTMWDSPTKHGKVV